ncbi:NAD(P)H-dependent oxidoreductase [Priestia endophytica]|jgi:NAD(P)H dehydrogenase (quinone)|uniref:NADPH:quinone reductase n=1 Tax=Priestia endophytica TaxID=135735 RepID=A0AAX1Q2L2_9BACI|nr:NAD(P)H-dependent oxidoreductase [Priestia endophytica]RAS71715.1 NADPH:quinone reductase [Priestia endophytica]RAS87253.1 NADPH:quinone reductase [Priestia endophytica]
MKKVLIIQGNPNVDSFCSALAEHYEKGALSKGMHVKKLEIGKMTFDPNLRYGYRKRMELEEDLLKAQELILWANHLVFVYPTWWGTMPAVLKGFIDRTFLPGFSYQYRKNSPLWDKLLKNKTARLIVTMDTPKWYYHFVYKKAGHTLMKKGILEFCGVKPVRISTIGSLKFLSTGKKQAWLEKIARLGEKAI